MSLYKNWSTDSDKEVNGIPVTFEADEDGSVPTFIVSRQGESNKEYMKALEVATKPYRRQMQLKTLSPEKDTEIFREVFASSVLKGWSNVKDEAGNQLPFSKANAIKLFIDLPEVYKELQAASVNVALFRKESLETEAKN